MRSLYVSAFLLALVATPSSADDVTGLDLDVKVIEIELGKTKEVPIGQTAHEWLCVPEHVIKARFATKASSGYWVIAGRMLGRTQCRVGTGLDDNDLIFDIFVTKSVDKPKPKPAKPKRGK
jgi:hypothetical protein